MTASPIHSRLPARGAGAVLIVSVSSAARIHGNPTSSTVARLKRESVSLAVLEHRPPTEALFDRRLRKVYPPRPKRLICPREVVAVEEDARGRQRLRGGRQLTLPDSEDERCLPVRCSDLEPALFAVLRVVREFEVQRF